MTCTLLSHSFLFFFFNDTATTEIYTLSLHDALPISGSGGDGRVAPISFLPCLAARGGAGDARRPRGMARRMEVGRHPRPDRASRRRSLPLVARRGADHRSVPRSLGRVGNAPRRDGPGRRGAGLLRRRADAVLGAAETHRTAEAVAEDPGRRASGVHGV